MGFKTMLGDSFLSINHLSPDYGLSAAPEGTRLMSDDIHKAVRVKWNTCRPGHRGFEPNGRTDLQLAGISGTS